MLRNFWMTLIDTKIVEYCVDVSNIKKLIITLSCGRKYTCLLLVSVDGYTLYIKNTYENKNLYNVIDHHNYIEVKCNDPYEYVYDISIARDKMIQKLSLCYFLDAGFIPLEWAEKQLEEFGIEVDSNGKIIYDFEVDPFI